MSSTGELIRVVVVDDHPFFRDGVRRGLDNSGYIRVVGEAGNGREAIEVIARESPDVALVNYQMPDLDGLTLTQALSRDRSPTRVLLLSALVDGSLVFQALRAGAAGYLPKDASRTEIIAAVREVAKGRDVVPGELAAKLGKQIRLSAGEGAPVLSDREREVLRAFAAGLSIPETARQLYLGVSTVKTYTERLYDKLGVSDRAAAVAEAMRRGVLE